MKYMLLLKKGKVLYIRRILFNLFYKIKSLIVNIDMPVDAFILSLMDRMAVNIILEMKKHN